MKASTKKLSISITVILIIVVLFLVCSVLIRGYLLQKVDNTFVTGNLGGVPVEIPRDYARFVGYNKGRYLKENSSDKKVAPAYQSKLRSLGFEVRYPDMASVKVQTKEEKDIFTTMWMRVGINTGEDYGVEGYLNRKKERYINPTLPCFSKCFNYHPLSNDIYGLTGYTPTGTGVDVEKRSVNFGRGTDMRDKNVYFFQNSTDHVTTFITCSNVAHAAAPCKQYFSLSPRMKAHIRVSYRKGLLSHWQEIQQSVSKLIYGFEVDINEHTSVQVN